MCELRAPRKSRSHAGIVERKPARSLRRGGQVGGDDFEEYHLAKPHQAIMGSHKGVLAPRRDDDAKALPDMLDACFECQCCDREVVQRREGGRPRFG